MRKDRIIFCSCVQYHVSVWSLEGWHVSEATERAIFFDTNNVCGWPEIRALPPNCIAVAIVLFLRLKMSPDAFFRSAYWYLTIEHWVRTQVELARLSNFRFGLICRAQRATNQPIYVLLSQGYPKRRSNKLFVLHCRNRVHC